MFMKIATLNFGKRFARQQPLILSENIRNCKLRSFGKNSKTIVFSIRKYIRKFGLLTFEKSLQGYRLWLSAKI